jgi:hypothetical protein
VTNRRRRGAYALTLAEIDEASLRQAEKNSQDSNKGTEDNFMTLRDHFNQFNKFMTAPNFRKRQEPPIRRVTANNHLQNIRLMLGWTHRYHDPQVPLEDLSLVKLVSSSGLTTEGQRDEEAIEQVMDVS